MSSVAGDAFDAATALVKTTWSDITKIYRPSVGTWFDWHQEIEAGNLVLPFAVIAPMAVTPVQSFGASNEVYSARFEAYYVRSSRLTTAEKGAGYSHVEQILEEKAEALRKALYAYAKGATPNHKFQCIERPTTDCSHTNPANATFVSKPYKYWSAMVAATLVFGQQ